MYVVCCQTRTPTRHMQDATVFKKKGGRKSGKIIIITIHIHVHVHTLYGCVIPVKQMVFKL